MALSSKRLSCGSSCYKAVGSELPDLLISQHQVKFLNSSLEKEHTGPHMLNGQTQHARGPCLPENLRCRTQAQVSVPPGQGRDLNGDFPESRYNSLNSGGTCLSVPFSPSIPTLGPLLHRGSGWPKWRPNQMTPRRLRRTLAGVSAPNLPPSVSSERTEQPVTE